MMSMYGMAMGAVVALALVVNDDAVTLKGWLSDRGCAEAKVKAEEVTPNGTVCVKKCSRAAQRRCSCIPIRGRSTRSRTTRP